MLISNWKKKNKIKYFFKVGWIISFLLSILMSPIFYILLAWIIIIIIVFIILSLFSLNIPFYYNITHTIFDIPVNIVKSNIIVNWNTVKNKDYINKIVNNKFDFYNILKLQLNTQQKYILANKTIPLYNKQLTLLHEKVNYITNLKFYEELWKNTFLKNLDLPLYLLKDIKTKIVNWNVIYLWDKNISFYYSLKKWEFNENSPLYIRIWNLISKYYKKYDIYKCNSDKSCYNKLPKVELYNNLIIPNKPVYWTLYKKENIPIEWFWIKFVPIQINWKEEKKIVFYLKTYNSVKENILKNTYNYKKKVDKIFWNNNNSNYSSFNYDFNYIYNSNSTKKVLLSASDNYTLRNPYIIVKNNEIQLNFQIQLLSLSSYLWNIKTNDGNKQLIYDVNMWKNQIKDVTWKWATNNIKKTIQNERNFNNNDYNNDNVIIKDKYNYLTNKNIDSKYLQQLNNQSLNIIESNSQAYKIYNLIKFNNNQKTSYNYYNYYVYNPYHKYLNDNKIYLYWISNNKNPYQKWPYIFGNSIINNHRIKKNQLLSNFCLIYKNWKEKWQKYYNIFHNNKIQNKNLSEIKYTLQNYCEKKYKNKSINVSDIQYLPLFLWNEETHKYLDWITFWKNEIKYLVNALWVVNIWDWNQINNWQIERIWKEILLNSIIIKFVNYSKVHNFKYKFWKDLNKNIDNFYKIEQWYKIYWNKSIYIDIWYKETIFKKIIKYLLVDWEQEYYKRYLNSLYTYIWYYQIKNNIKKIEEWKRNPLEYLMYYYNTNTTPFKVLDFTSLNNLLQNNNSLWNNENYNPVSLSNYPYIVKSIQKDFYNKQNYTFSYENNSLWNNNNFVTIKDWKIIKYNYCDDMLNSWKFDVKNTIECKKFTNWWVAFLKLEKENKTKQLQLFSYRFYEKWFKQYKMFEWFWNKRWLFPYWKQATLDKAISNWRYPWQCVHYITINIKHSKLYWGNAENWCNVAKWKKWFKVIENINTVRQKIWPWDIIVFNHFVNWINNNVWHIAMVSQVNRKLNWNLKDIKIQEFNAWCWNSYLWSKYIRGLFNNNWLNTSNYYLKWCIFYYNIKTIKNYNLSRWEWWNNSMPMKCIIKVTNPNDYNNLTKIFHN